MNPPRTAATLPPLKHAWRGCICQGTASEILRADVQSALRKLQKEIGYRHIRFHASFHDDLGVVDRLPDGRLIYNWALLDQVYDFLVEIGFDPIVEFNPMPKAIASGDQTFFFYKMNVTPPRLMAEWEQLVGAFTRHCIERYTLPRVLRWKFEVWNEPNLNGQFWTGTEEEYFELYAASTRAVKAIHPALQIGGPASAGGLMCLGFAEWCRARSVPVDFLSFHNYPAGEYGSYPGRVGSPHAPGMAFSDEFRQTKEKLAAAGFGDIPILITEWSTLTCGPTGKPQWIGSADCTRLFSASAILHHVLHTEPHVDILGWWTASDVLHEAAVTSRRYGAHNQYYGLIDLAGEPKPGFHAFSFLSRLTGPRYAVDLGERPPLADGLVTDETVTTRALLWNFHMPEFESQTWTGRLRLPLPAHLASAARVRLATATLAPGAGSAYETWISLGRPASQTRIDEQALRAAAQPRHRSLIATVENGHAVLPFSLNRDEVLFAEVVALDNSAHDSDAVTLSAELEKLNRALDYPGAKA